jgi:1-acyl-sn-glycerol-3-phosphate acyltransferase
VEEAAVTTPLLTPRAQGPTVLGPKPEVEAAIIGLVTELAQELRKSSRRIAVGRESALDRELGIDSLARIELLMRIERRLGVAIAQEDALAAETVGDLLSALSRAAAVPVAEAVGAGAAASAPVEGGPLTAQTLVEALAWHAERHGDRPHVTLLFDAPDGAPRSLNYAQLLLGARHLAAGLTGLGVGAGDSVALMLPTSLDFFTAFYGVLFAGAVPVPIYPPFRMSQIEEHLRRQSLILRNARAKVLVTTSQAARVGQWLEAAVPSMRAIVTVTDLQAPVLVASPSIGTGDVALLQYTSGSTGDPKGVVLTHANLLANVRAMGEAAAITSADTVVSWLPLYHDMGLIAAWLASLYYGMPLVLMPPAAFLARPQRWLWAIHQHRGTLSAAPNFAFEICASRIDERELEGLDLRCWRRAFDGSEPVSPGTVERFLARFERYGFVPEAFAPVYGLAECSVALTFPPLHRSPRVDRVARDPFVRDGRAIVTGAQAASLSFVACGIPLPGHEVRVVDEAGRELPARVQGRIQFRGPSATSGYRDSPEASKALRDGAWLNTGDLGYIAEADLFVTGRAKDVIIRAGRHVFPYELEEVVGRVPGVRRGAVVAFACADEPSGTERLVIVAETRETDEGRRAHLRAEIERLTAERLGMAPEDVVLVPPRSVPKTSSGKLRRNACRELYRHGQLGRSRAIGWQVTSLVLQVLPGLARRLASWALKWLFAAWFWLCYGGLALPAFLGVLLLPGQHRRRRFVGAIVRAFFRVTFIPVTLDAFERLPSSPAILVANHPSYLDGILLLAVLPPRYRPVAKRELERRWLTRTALSRLGVLFVERFEHRRGTQDSRRLEQAVREGDSLLLFPEGTTQRAPGVFPFHLGAFAIATTTAAPVVPVAIHGLRTVLRSDQWFPRRGGVRVAVLTPLLPAGSTWQAELDLRDRARAALAGNIGEPMFEQPPAASAGAT